MTAPNETRTYMPSRIYGPFLAVMLFAGVALAQTPPVPGPQAPLAPQPAGETASGFERIVLTAGRSTVLATDFDITRIAVDRKSVV